MFGSNIRLKSLLKEEETVNVRLYFLRNAFLVFQFEVNTMYHDFHFSSVYRPGWKHLTGIYGVEILTSTFKIF